MITAFVYLWHDTKRNKFCIGSHIGHPDDGYVSSTGWMKHAYKKRPTTFRRRILWSTTEMPNKHEVFGVEQKFLDMIKDEELGSKYYNLKKFAAGGNGSANSGKVLSEEHRKAISKGLVAAKIKRPPTPIEVRIKQSTSQLKRASREIQDGTRYKVVGKRLSNQQNPKRYLVSSVKEDWLTVSEICEKYNLKNRNVFHLIAKYLDKDIPILKGSMKGFVLRSERLTNS